MNSKIVVSTTVMYTYLRQFTYFDRIEINLNLYTAVYFCILDPSILLFLCILENMTIVY